MDSNPNGGYDKMPASWRGRKRTGPCCSSTWTRDAVARTSCNLVEFVSIVDTHCCASIKHSVVLGDRSEVEEVGMFLVGRSRQKNAEGARHRPSTSTWVVSFLEWRFLHRVLETLLYVDWLCVRVLFSLRSLFFGTTAVRPMLVFSRTVVPGYGVVVLDDCIIVIRQANHTDKLAQEESGVGPFVIELNRVSPSLQCPRYFMACDTADVGRDAAGLVNQDRSTTGLWIVSSPRLSDPEAECGRCLNAASTIWKAELGSSWPSDCGRNCWYHSQERIRQCTVEQVADSPVPQIVEEISEVMRLRTAEKLPRSCFLGSVAALDRYQPGSTYRRAWASDTGRSSSWTGRAAGWGMLQPTSVKKADSNSELWTVYEMAWPTSISPQSSALQAAGYRSPVSDGVYRLCSGDVCVQLTLQNYVDTSWTRLKTVSLAFVCLHAEENLFQPRFTSPRRNNIIACAIRFRAWKCCSFCVDCQIDLHFKKRLTSSLTETSPRRSTSPVRGTGVPATSHQQMTMKRDIDIRKDVYAHVVLSGGTIMFKELGRWMFLHPRWGSKKLLHQRECTRYCCLSQTLPLRARAVPAMFHQLILSFDAQTVLFLFLFSRLVLSNPSALSSALTPFIPLRPNKKNAGTKGRLRVVTSALKHKETKETTKVEVKAAADTSSNTQTATFHFARDVKAVTMKQKCVNTKIRKEEEEADSNFETLTMTCHLVW